MSEPYSDKRWWIAPRGIDSDCNSCIFDYGFNKCEKYPDGIPKEIVKKSFPGTEAYKKKYCKYRKTN